MTPKDLELIEELSRFYSVAMPYVMRHAAKDDEAMSIMSVGMRVGDKLTATMRERAKGVMNDA